MTTINFKNWFYQSSILIEINHNIAKSMSDIYDSPENLPFKALFKSAVPENPDATRFSVKFTKPNLGLSILKKLRDQGFEIDFDNGFLVKNNRPIKIGKYVLGGKSGMTQEEKNWFISQGNSTAALKTLFALIDEPDYSLIVSRNPFDVVRMGDFSQILNQAGKPSCHAPSGGFFNHAIMDARNNGGIAYLVKSDDLKNVNLDDKEIFQDDERSVNGILPVSRLRIRRFVDKTNKSKDLAIPEKRLYGKNIPGFYEFLRSVIFTHQQDIISNSENERPRLKNYNLAGGSHQDTAASELFNKFFQDNLDRGVADNEGNEEMGEVYEQECDQIQRRTERRLTNSDVTYNIIDDDNIPIVHYQGNLNFNIEKEMFTKEFIYIFENEDKKEFNIAKHKISKMFRDIITVNCSGLEFNSFSFEKSGNLFTLSINVTDINAGNNPDDFSEFCDNLVGADDSIKEIYEKILYDFSTTSIPLPNYKTNIFVIKKAHYIPVELQDMEIDPDEQDNYKNFILKYKNEYAYDADFLSRYWENIYTLDQSFVQNVKREIEEIYTALDEAEDRFTTHFDESFVKYSLMAEPIKRRMLSKFENTFCSFNMTFFGLNDIKEDIISKIANIFTNYEANKLRRENENLPNLLEKIKNLGFNNIKDFIKAMVWGRSNIEPCLDFELSCLEEHGTVSKYELKDPHTASTSVLIRTKLHMNSYYNKIKTQEIFKDFVQFLDDNYESYFSILETAFKSTLERITVSRITSYMKNKKEIADDYIKFLDAAIAKNLTTTHEIKNKQNDLFGYFI